MADMNERENDNAMIDEIKAVGGCCFAMGRREKEEISNYYEMSRFGI